MKTIIFTLLFILSCFTVFNQNISGNIKGVCAEGDHPPKNLAGATIRWDGTNIAAASDKDGNFTIKYLKNNKLIISYLGYKNDTLSITSDSILSIMLVEENSIGEVQIHGDQHGEYINQNSNVHIKKITEAGLKKLPCCNLSESFENTADIDVSFSDAVSGAKQIQMLGLAGIYSQILVENIPTIRGLGQAYGLSHIAGPWMQSIQISKGSSAVINGYESITGQINIELQKPDKSDKFYFNLFGNSSGRSEINSYSAIKLNDKLSTILLLHASTIPFISNDNHDNFADEPLSKQLNFANRWLYSNTGKGIESQIGFRALIENRKGGEIDFLNSNDRINNYGINVNTKRIESYYKLGAFLNFLNEASIGSTFAVVYHNQNSFYGNNNYDATEKSFYGNIIFEKEIFSHEHKLNIGTSLLADDYSELLNQTNYNRFEFVPGAFVQYTFEEQEKFSAILGYRVDFHNIYGAFHTIRAHMKANIGKTITLRASAGKGYRVANIFSENIGVLATSRQIIIANDILPEIAWNYGINLSKKFEISSRQTISWSFDFYRTDFENQVIVDLDADVNYASFYNLQGKSYSNSFQSDLTIDVIRGFVFTFAGRFNDVKITMHDQLIDKPLMSKLKGIFVFSYTTRNKKWILDITNQFTGKSKLPDTKQNPLQYQLPEYSPAFYQLHAQITKKFKKLEIYAGAENITNYMQMHPILGHDNPFGEYFDSSIIWGPIMGRTFYFGLRLTIK